MWDERRQLPSLRAENNKIDLTLYDRDDGAARGDFLGHVTVKMMNFVSKTMNFVFKTMNFAFKIM